MKTPEEITQEMVNDLANRALDELVFEGKTLREWIRVINASKELNIIEILSKQLRRVERERDAAVADLTELARNDSKSHCEYCKRFDDDYCPVCYMTNNEGFEWRGVQKEG